MKLGSLAATAVTAAVALCASPARADVSSWLALGAGAAGQYAHGASSPDGAPVMTYSIGVGTSPRAPFVFGVLYRGTTMFGLGTDAGGALRLATGAFARGDWGLAIDLGAAYRGWSGSNGGSYGAAPAQGVVTFGSPWGLQLAVGAQAFALDGGVAAEGGFAALEIDLLRFTVMRQGPSERWLPNPNPAGGREKASLLSYFFSSALME
jgi:hypothetical protein